MEINELLVREIVDLRAQVRRLLRLEQASGLRVITSGAVTLQPALSVGNWLYTNTQIAIPATTGSYHVLTAVRAAPATVWTTDQTSTTFILWAAIDAELTQQAATPTIWYVVVQ